jgi:hypothetical protein
MRPARMGPRSQHASRALGATMAVRRGQLGNAGRRRAAAASVVQLRRGAGRADARPLAARRLLTWCVRGTTKKEMAGLREVGEAASRHLRRLWKLTQSWREANGQLVGSWGTRGLHRPNPSLVGPPHWLSAAALSSDACPVHKWKVAGAPAAAAQAAAHATPAGHTAGSAHACAPPARAHAPPRLHNPAGSAAQTAWAAWQRLGPLPVRVGALQAAGAWAAGATLLCPSCVQQVRCAC